MQAGRGVGVQMSVWTCGAPEIGEIIWVQERVSRVVRAKTSGVWDDREGARGGSKGAADRVIMIMVMR